MHDMMKVAAAATAAVRAQQAPKGSPLTNDVRDMFKRKWWDPRRWVGMTHDVDAMRNYMLQKYPRYSGQVGSTPYATGDLRNVQSRLAQVRVLSK